MAKHRWRKIVLTSYPPQYEWVCDRCGEVVKLGYVDSFEEPDCDGCSKPYDIRPIITVDGEGLSLSYAVVRD